MLSEQDVMEFKKLYKSEYGIDLDATRARLKAERLFLLIKATYKPIPIRDKQLFEKLGKENEKT